MSANRFIWSGLEEMKAALRQLPEELTGEGAVLVARRADGAANTIKFGYPSRTGDLRDGVEVEHRRTRFSATSIVRNRKRHALPFELGTQARHTRLGAHRGSMPANALFTRTVMRARWDMYEDLAALLRRHGLTVTGDA